MRVLGARIRNEVKFRIVHIVIVDFNEVTVHSIRNFLFVAMPKRQKDIYHDSIFVLV